MFKLMGKKIVTGEGGYLFPYFPENKGLSLVPQKVKICFIMFPVPQIVFVPLFPSNFWPLFPPK